MNQVTNPKARIIEGTTKLIRTVKNCDSDAMKELNWFSIPRLLPLISPSQFVGIHSSVDVYSTVSFVLLHVFYLGVSKLVKVCSAQYLMDAHQKCSSITTSSRTFGYIASTRRMLWYMLNHFLKKVMGTIGYGLEVNLGKDYT